MRFRGLGEERSTFWPSLSRAPLPDASWNHLEMRCRDESSVAGGGMSARLGVPGDAASAEASSLSLRRSGRDVCGLDGVLPVFHGAVQLQLD